MPPFAGSADIVAGVRVALERSNSTIISLRLWPTRSACNSKVEANGNP